MVDWWCYLATLRTTKVHMWDRPMLENNCAFEPRLTLLAGRLVNWWAQLLLFPLVQRPQPDITSWNAPCLWVHSMIPLSSCQRSRVAAQLGRMG